MIVDKFSKTSIWHPCNKLGENFLDYLNNWALFLAASTRGFWTALGWASCVGAAQADQADLTPLRLLGLGLLWVCAAHSKPSTKASSPRPGPSLKQMEQRPWRSGPHCALLDRPPPAPRGSVDLCRGWSSAPGGLVLRGSGLTGGSPPPLLFRSLPALPEGEAAPLERLLEGKCFFQFLGVLLLGEHGSIPQPSGETSRRRPRSPPHQQQSLAHLAGLTLGHHNAFL